MGGVIGKAVTETRTAEQAYINASTPPSPSQQANEARQRNLLNRDRGIFGTIQTGFRGLLGIATQNKIRKTLLGE
ncbi:MAG: hypothetical protein KA155_02310 [Alphaproteobacteria bacterium]|jgi:hypothetical protein|nr:hypothetical protein [Alphaproteobacteria bacterium]